MRVGAISASRKLLVTSSCNAREGGVEGPTCGRNHDGGSCTKHYSTKVTMLEQAAEGVTARLGEVVGPHHRHSPH